MSLREEPDAGSPEPSPAAAGGSHSGDSSEPEPSSTVSRTDTSLPRSSASVVADSPEHWTASEADGYGLVITAPATASAQDQATDPEYPNATVIQFEDDVIEVTRSPTLSYADVIHRWPEPTQRSQSIQQSQATVASEQIQQAKTEIANRRRQTTEKRKPIRNKAAAGSMPSPYALRLPGADDAREPGFPPRLGELDPQAPQDLDPLSLQTEEERVEERAAARRRGDLQPFQRSSLSGYEYRRDEVVGPALEGNKGVLTAPDSAEFAMKQGLQLNPNAFFPFNVTPVDGGSASIRLGGVYHLSNRGAIILMPPGRHLVKVISVTRTSFTFEALPGHFDPPGSQVTFRTYVEDGLLHLEHEGVTTIASTPGAEYLAAPTIADIVWSQQTENLRNWYNSIQPGGR